MKRPTYIIIFMLTLIAGLTLAQIGVANQVSTTGAELATLQNKVVDIQRENSVIQEQILEASSFTNLSEKADKLAFVPSSSQVVLNPALPLAYKQ